MAKYYYQKINNIGKQVALVSSNKPINDPTHYREVDKEYYDAVIALLREQAEENAKNEGED